MSDIKLLPCPCCGSEAKIGILEKHFTFYRAVCLECGLTAKATPTPELTAEKWNTRKPMEELKKGNVITMAITFNKEEMQKIVDEKVKDIELDIQAIKNQAIDDFADRLSKYLDVENATKYGNENAEQQIKSYDTLMKYEIAWAIDDVAEQLKEGGKNE